MARPWFRFYRKTVNNPKAQRLRPELFKAWVNILCATDDNGNLPLLNDLAFTLRVARAKLDPWLCDLIEAKLLTARDGLEGLRAHDWSDHNYDSDTDSTARDRKRRQRAKSRVTLQSGHAKVTRTDTEEDTDTDTEPKATPLAASPADLWKQVWDSGRAYLTKNGHSEGDARTQLMRWRQNHNETEILRALKTAEANAVELPIPYINALLKDKPNGSRQPGAIARIAAKVQAARAEQERQSDIRET